jgi:hypothetical protein
MTGATTRRLGPALVAGWLLAIGCGGGGGAPDGAPGDAGPAGDASGPPIFDSPPVSILVAEAVWGSGVPYGDVRATAYDQPQSFHTEIAREGACRLLAYRASACDPACDYDQWCTADGECVAWPTVQSAGRITLSGLATPVTLSFFGSYYRVDQYPLPGELFDPGDPISASAPGADVAGFTVTAAGVAPATLAMTGEQSDELHLYDGDDVTVSWSPADPAARVRLELLSPNQSHGMPSNWILQCDAPDLGSLVIPRELVESVPEQPRLEACVSVDCPPSTFLRYRRGTTSGGQVELLIASETYFYLVH